MVGQMSEKFEIDIESSHHFYKIVLQNNQAQIQQDESKIVLIDSNLMDHAAHVLSYPEKIVDLPGNENSKQFSKLEYVLETFAKLGLRRGDSIAVIGGGTIQDIATIATSLYMRGIQWEYHPTTLASMMDSCVGGKSSINLGTRKNLIGNFHPPSKIVINPGYISTLPAVEISAGIAEGVKICFARGESFLRSFVENINIWRETGETQYLIESMQISLESKKFFIEIDEFDQKERQLLNFGHSFGHALESSSEYSIPHGVAVLIGMMAAHLYVGNSTSNPQFIDFLIAEYKVSGFSNKKIQINRKQLLKALSQDKKNSNLHQVLILPSEIGTLRKVDIPLTASNLEKSANAAIGALNMLGGNFEIL